MTKTQLQKEWRNLSREIHNIPQTFYSKKIVFARTLLLSAEVILAKIENKENVLFNGLLYKKIIAQYHNQKAKS